MRYAPALSCSLSKGNRSKQRRYVIHGVPPLLFKFRISQYQATKNHLAIFHNP
jgi:hypothetical protein